MPGKWHNKWACIFWRISAHVLLARCELRATMSRLSGMKRFAVFCSLKKGSNRSKPATTPGSSASRRPSSVVLSIGKTSLWKYAHRTAQYTGKLKKTAGRTILCSMMRTPQQALIPCRQHYDRSNGDCGCLHRAFGQVSRDSTAIWVKREESHFVLLARHTILRDGRKFTTATESHRHAGNELLRFKHVFGRSILTWKISS